MSSPVYVDELFVWPARGAQAHRVGQRHGHRWCHMWSDDLKALHDMARKIGMRREWFQNKPGFPHYDLVPTRRAMAIRYGAIEKPLIDWKRERMNQSGSQEPRKETQPMQKLLLSLCLFSSLILHPSSFAGDDKAKDKAAATRPSLTSPTIPVNQSGTLRDANGKITGTYDVTAGHVRLRDANGKIIAEGEARKR